MGSECCIKQPLGLQTGQIPCVCLWNWQGDNILLLFLKSVYFSIIHMTVSKHAANGVTKSFDKSRYQMVLP